MAGRTKLSASQLTHVTKSRHDLTGGEVAAWAYDAGEEQLVHRWTWEHTREDPEWATRTVELLKDHAEGAGPGTRKYVVRTSSADGVVRELTWCTVHVPRGERAPDAGDELDGSVGAWVAHLQRAFEEERKFRLEQARESAKAQTSLMQQTTEMASSVMKLLGALSERTQTLEKAQRETIEAEKSEIATMREQFVREALEAERNAEKPSGGGIFDDLQKIIADKIGDKLAEELAPVLAPMAKDFFGKMGADAPTPTVIVSTPSAPPDPAVS